jgi:ribonuclease HI/endonuclease/exonuclease/phosphatase family metal-dependent hydrolase
MDFNRKTRTNSHWRVIYPSTYYTDLSAVRSVILVNTRISTNVWRQIDVPSSDITAIQISGDFGNISIFNIYNDCKHSRNIRLLEQSLFLLNNRHRRDANTHLLWAGDFNRHHPMWDEPRNHHLFTRRALRESQILIDLITDYAMSMALPKGLPTLRAHRTKNWTRVDNVFYSEGLEGSITRCTTLPGRRGVKTDHVPIITHLDLPIAQAKEENFHDFRSVIWEDFRDELVIRLEGIPPPVEITNQQQFERAIKDLTTTIKGTIEAVVDFTKPCPHTKRWWTKELSALKKQVNRISEVADRFRALPQHEIHAERKRLVNRYANAIQSTKTAHWKVWLEDVSGNDIWVANKYASGDPTDGGRTRIPTLHVKQPNGTVRAIHSNNEKSDALCKTFFPPPPDELGIDPDFNYPPPIAEFQPITKERLIRSTRKLKPFKAAGLDEIPNVVLKETIDILADYLLQIFNAIVKLGIYYEPWRDYVTVVLRKPGKPDYSVTKAHRPVALLNTMSKLFTSIIAEDLTFLSEKYQLLPTTQFGGRPGRTTTDAMHYLTQRVKNAWRKGKVMSALFLDIEGAFPNAVPERLAHNMRVKGIPKEYSDLVLRILQGRRTKLRFDDYTSDFFDIRNGIGQGDPFSMILYLFYNADLVDVPKGKEEGSSAFVDDITYLAEGDTFEETHQRLADMVQRDGGANDWSNDHNSRFEISKSAVVDFGRARIQDPQRPRRTRLRPRPPLHLGNAVVQPSDHHKFLGIIFDQELNWKEKAAKAIGKGAKWVSQIIRLSRPSTGVASKYIRQMYVAVAVSKMTYAVDVWYTPVLSPRQGRRTGSVGITQKIASVQRTAGLAITGALRSTATDSIDALANLLPADLMMRKACYRAATRLLTLPKAHPLHPFIKRCRKRYVKRHKSPVHKLLHTFRLRRVEVETIHPVMRHPGYIKAFHTYIAKSAEDAIKQDKDLEDTADIRIYADGSGYEGNTGACAILYRGNRKRSLRYQLGSLKDHTVFNGEAVAVVLGLHLLDDEEDPGVVSFSIDNQAVIKATDTNKVHSGQSLIDQILHAGEELKRTKGNSLDLTLRWIPGHSEVKGNEEVDKGAKKAAEGRGSNKRRLPGFLADRALPSNVSAMRQAHTEELVKEWKRRWSKSRRHQRLSNIDSDIPSKKSTGKLTNFSKGLTSLVVQLRTGHVPLNSYLFRISKSDTDTCPSCQDAPETVHHYLFDCVSYGRERHKRYTVLRRDSDSLSFLLNDPRGIRELGIYVNRTRRFRSIFGEIRVPDSDQK